MLDSSAAVIHHHSVFRIATTVPVGIRSVSLWLPLVPANVAYESAFYFEALDVAGEVAKSIDDDRRSLWLFVAEAPRDVVGGLHVLQRFAVATVASPLWRDVHG